MPFGIAALLPKTASAKTRTAGHGGSMAKVRDAGRRRFGRNPDGTAPARAQRRVTNPFRTSSTLRRPFLALRPRRGHRSDPKVHNTL
jgi:hypothetical protein